MSVLLNQQTVSSAPMLISLVVLFVFMYFFMIRPQQKETKKKNSMLALQRLKGLGSWRPASQDNQKETWSK